MTVLHLIARPRASGRVIDVAVRSIAVTGSTTGPLCGNLSLTVNEWHALRAIMTASPLARGQVKVDERRDEVAT